MNKIYLITILLILYITSISSFGASLRLEDDKFVYSIPEQYFNEGLDYIRDPLYKRGLKDLYFYISHERLVIGGVYRFLPFKVYFEVVKKNLWEYEIIIRDFKFFNFISYSKRRLVDSVLGPLANDREISSYVKITKENKHINIKLKKELYKIFPRKYYKKKEEEI